VLEAHPRLRRFAKGVVSGVNRPVATVRFRRAVRGLPRPIALEVGGLTPRPGWFMVNVNATTPHYMDGTKPWIFEDGSLSHIYADNMIEHVPLAGARAFLAEAHRCLRPGGTIRLVTPDVRAHVDLYLSGGRAVLESNLAKEYREVGAVIEHPIDMLRAPIGDFGHHVGYVYDFETLDDELRRAGFAGAVRKELGESDDPMLRGLEFRQNQGSAQLVVEASRPAG
jgi:predicted SAM-dependent methyltransferase